MGRSSIVAGGALLLLSACGTSGAVQTQVGFDGYDPNSAKQEHRHPYMGFQIKAPPSCPCGQKQDAPLYSDYYILAATSFTPAANSDPQSYDKANRGLLGRFFFGRNVNFTLQASLTIDGTTIPLPLYAMSHNSNAQDGETFSADLSLVSHDLYVRVTDSTPINANFSAVYTETTESNLISTGVQVAKTAVMAISPNAHMLTTLSKPSLQQQSKIWDAALNKLLAESIQEKTSVAILPGDLKSGAYGLITLSIPGPDGKLDPSQAVGFWTIGASPKNIRRSLFSSDPAVEQAAWEQSVAKPPTGVSSSQILSEYVGISADQTVQNFIKTGPVNDALNIWSSAAKDTDAAKDDKTKKSAATDKETASADAVCRTAVESLYGLGLSTVDARLGLWAILDGMPLPGTPSTDHVKGLRTACKTYIAPFAFKEA